MKTKKTLIMGFFSTVGDVECLDIVRCWLKELDMPYDVAPYGENVRIAIPGSLDPVQVDAKQYSHLLIICGPCWKDLFRKRKIDLSRFSHCIRIGLNLTMIDPIDEWNPFDVLLERDSDRIKRPDMTFLKSTGLVPVVGRCLAPRPRNKHYEGRERFDQANGVINRLIEKRELAVIDIDTRWPASRNTAGQKNAGQVASIMSRVDVMLTTRLHGMVFSIKSEVPVIAVDFISGGEKVTAQGRAINWPMTVLAEEATDQWMDEAFEWCLSEDAKDRVKVCRESVEEPLNIVKSNFFTSFIEPITPHQLSTEIKPNLLERLRRHWSRK